MDPVTATLAVLGAVFLSGVAYGIAGWRLDNGHPWTPTAR